jgi:hypothetical protein
LRSAKAKRRFSLSPLTRSVSVLPVPVRGGGSTAVIRSTAEWAQAVIADIERMLLPREMLRQVPEHERFESMALTAATYTDEFFDKELTLDARLDAMIDRAVKRLVQTKALKQMLGQTDTKRTTERSESGKVLKLPDRK